MRNLIALSPQPRHRPPMPTKRKPAKPKAETLQRGRRDSSQIVKQATGTELKKSNWLSEPASKTWTGRKIRHKTSGKEYVIGDVFGERHVEVDRYGKTTIHNAANLRESYEPI